MLPTNALPALWRFWDIDRSDRAFLDKIGGTRIFYKIFLAVCIAYIYVLTNRYESTIIYT